MKELRGLLRELYLEGKLSTLQIASQFGMHPSTIGKHLKRAGIKIRTINDRHKGQKPPMLGKHHSEATRQKLREGGIGNQNAKGHVMSEKAKQGISKKLKGRTMEELGHKPDCQCHFCKIKRGELFERPRGKESHNYEHGYSLTRLYRTHMRTTGDVESPYANNG